MAPLLRKNKDRMILTGVRIELTDGLEQGRRGGGDYAFAIDGDVVRRIKKQIPGLLIEPELMEKFRGISAKQKKALEIASATDWPGDERLFDYQRVAVAWLSVVERGILCEEQGLGKTVEALWAAEQTPFEHAVVVCGNSKKKDWKDHGDIWTTRESRILAGDMGTREAILQDWKFFGGILICNYSTVVIHDEFISQVADFLIADECQAVRNRKTYAFASLKKISRRCHWVYLLTASPVMNLTGDLYALLALIDLKRFGSYWSFVCRFCKVTSGYGGSMVVGGVREDERDNLDQLLSAYMLGRPKSIGYDLPTQSSRTLSYELKGSHLELYREFESTDSVVLTDRTIDADVKVACITRLRQLAISPALLDPLYKGPDKFDLLPDLIREREGKVLIFTMFAQAAAIGAEKLNKVGIKTVILDGTMSDKQRQESLDNFQKGDARVLIMTIKTGGEGLNLTQANRVYFIDKPWNPASIEHAQARVHRLGQEEETEVIFISAKDTIEEHIDGILAKKEKVTINRLIRRIRAKEKV